MMKANPSPSKTPTKGTCCLLFIRHYFTATLLFTLALVGGTAAQAADSEPYFSPNAMVADSQGRTLFITAYSAKKLAFVEPATGKVLTTLDLPHPPNGLALSPDGQKLAVTMDDPEGAVAVIGVAKRTLSTTWHATHFPTAPVFSKDGKLLYVANRFENTVSVLDTTTGAQTQKWKATREPIAAALSLDDKTLFVVNHLPSQPSTAAEVNAVVTALDTATGQATTIDLPNGSTGALGITLSPDGKFAYVTHTLARYQLPTTQLDRGWMNTAAVSVIDTAAKKWVNTVLLDDIDLGTANPWPIACTADGKTIVVGIAGTHELLLVDRNELHTRLSQFGAKANPTDSKSQPPTAQSPPKKNDEKKSTQEYAVPKTAYNAYATDPVNDLSFLVGARQRVKLSGNGIRSLAIVNATVYAAGYFSDTLESIDLTKPLAASTVFPLAPARPVSQIRQGERAFHDATLCFQQWQSCMSCHPGNARVDGLNWDLLNDGIGNPKNVRSLLLSPSTPPVMSLGVRADAATAVRSGFRYILFSQASEEDANAVHSYLESLQPVPSPYLVKGQLSESALRGKALFENVGCVKCHSSPLFTTLEAYDVGTISGSDSDRKVDVPTLIELWRTAPYLHDGRAATVMDVLTGNGHEGISPKTEKMSAEKLRDLEAYLLSL
jgi:YVTN family beta-propeller protein